MMKDVNSMIKRMEEKRAELDNTKREQESKVANRETYLRNVIKSWADDFKELATLANAMQDNGFSLNDESHLGMRQSSFCTNGIQHYTGFFTERPYNVVKDIKGFGIECGGCDGNIDLFIDFDGNVITSGQVSGGGQFWTMERFVREFPTFKEKFLQFVEKTIK